VFDNHFHLGLSGVEKIKNQHKPLAQCKRARKADEPQVGPLRTHGKGLSGQQLKAFFGWIIVASIAAQFDQGCDIAAGGEKRIGFLALIEEGNEHLTVAHGGRQGPGMADTDIACTRRMCGRGTRTGKCCGSKYLAAGQVSGHEGNRE